MAADYYAILKNAIGGLPDSTGEARRAVYEKARRAVVDQLKSFDPPLSATEITQERLRLEDCIRRVESEAAKGILTQSLGRTVAPPPPPPPSQPAYREPEPRTRAYEPPTNARPAYRSEPEPMTGMGMDRAPTGLRTAPTGNPYQAGPNGNGNGYAPPPALPRADQGYAHQGLRQMSQDVDQLGAAVVETAQQTRDTLMGMQQPGPVQEPQTGSQRARPAPAPATFGEPAFGQPRRSKMPMIAALSVGILVIGLGVAALWTQHERIASYLGVQKGFGIGAKTDPGAIPPKSSDRLGSDDPAAPKPDPSVKAVQTQQIQVPDQTPKAPKTADPAPVPAPAPAPVLPPVAQAAPAPAIPAPSVQPVPFVAQKVTLMEEGPAGISQPVFTSGKVVWQLVKESPAAGKAPIAVVRARIDIPDRKIGLLLSITPNTDASLPASHIAEMRFSPAPDFDGKGVANVPGLIMKPSEQNPGQPLIGASQKISGNYFWIALTGNDPDRARNLQLMKDSSWMSIPVVYDNGKRGLITVEKSGAGDRVMADAFAAWGP